MDYNKIKTFAKVAELGSVTEAARQLRRSQSAISQQIQSLEEELGLKLLERKNAKIFLSTDGEALYASARVELSRIDEIVLGLQKPKITLEGHIRLGAHHNYSTDLQIGEQIGAFNRKYPSVSFEIKDGTSSEIEESMIRNELDLGFIVVFKQPEMFIRQEVSRSSHSLYATETYLKSHPPIKTIQDLPNHRLIDLTDDFVCLAPFVFTRSKKALTALKHRKPNITAPNFQIAKDVILSNTCIGMLPDFLVERDKKKKCFRKILTSSKQYHAGLDVAYRSNRTLSLCEKKFISFLNEHKKE